MVQRWYKSGPKVTPKWSKNNPKSILGLGWGDFVVHKWFKSGPKGWSKSGSKVIQKWLKNGSKVIQKWFIGGPRVIQRLLKGVPKVTPKADPTGGPKMGKNVLGLVRGD